MGTTGKLAIALIALVIAGVLFFALREDESPEARPSSAASEGQADGADESLGGSAGEAKPKPDPEPKPEKPEIPRIVIEGGQPVGGVQELSFAKGERIRFVVESDVADHVHLHGYDIFQDIAAGGTARFDVAATIEGVFEVELEDTVVPIAEITVEPG